MYINTHGNPICLFLNLIFKMEIEDTTLIRTIKKYPQVYDPTTQEFKSLDDKEKAWNSIALEIGYDGDLYLFS
jgi:hypothetical protein